MRHILTTTLLAATTLVAGTAVQAGNSSSNSSSNSSNGVTTRVDTILRDDGRGRRTYERRVYEERTVNGSRRSREWRSFESDDD